MKRFGIWLILALVGFVFSNVREVISAPEVDYATIINLAGRQRMLTQKISKEILLIAWNIDVEKNIEELKKTTATFESALNGLINGDKELGLAPAVNRDIVTQLNNVKTLWNDFRVIVNEAVTSRNTSESIIKKASDLNLPLLDEADEVVMMYEVEAEQVTDKGGALVINLAGRQRMLTQKMAKEFLFITLNVNAEENKLRLKHTTDLFERTLKGLVKGDKFLRLPPTTNKNIVQQLSMVQSLWHDFKKPIDTALTTGKWSQDSIRKIADLNLPLLTEMHKAVRMFENEYHPGLAAGRDVWLTY